MLKRTIAICLAVLLGGQLAGEAQGSPDSHAPTAESRYLMVKAKIWGAEAKSLEVLAGWMREMGLDEAGGQWGYSAGDGTVRVAAEWATRSFVVTYAPARPLPMTSEVFGVLSSKAGVTSVRGPGEITFRFEEEIPSVGRVNPPTTAWETVYVSLADGAWSRTAFFVTYGQ